MRSLRVVWLVSTVACSIGALIACATTSTEDESFPTDPEDASVENTPDITYYPSDASRASAAR